MIKNRGGYTTLYSVSLVLITAALIYSYFLQDSIHYVSKEKQRAMEEEKESAEIKCDQGMIVFGFNCVLSTVLIRSLL